MQFERVAYREQMGFETGFEQRVDIMVCVEGRVWQQGSAASVTQQQQQQPGDLAAGLGTTAEASAAANTNIPLMTRRSQLKRPNGPR